MIATALRLNFACGGSRWDGFDNSDNNREPGTTFVDLKQTPYPYDDGSAELILISHGLFMGEHGVPMHPDLRPIMAEFHRILQWGGWLRIDDNPIRCFSPGEYIDERQAYEESQRGFLHEWKLPRARLIEILLVCGFSVVTNLGISGTSVCADLFPDRIAEGIVANQMGHYSFAIEAQK